VGESVGGWPHLFKKIAGRGYGRIRSMDKWVIDRELAVLFFTGSVGALSLAR